MEHARVNSSGKIWLLWNEKWEREIILDTIQQIIVKFTHQISQQQALITVVYARCSAIERLKLWDDIECVSKKTSIPWLVGGDFNVIFDDSEKLGGLPITQMETSDFAQCLSNCVLTKLPFSKSLYTWLNRRTGDDSIFKRLDRVLGNDNFWQQCNQSGVEHLIRDDSDLALLHIACTTGLEAVKKPFRFLNFQTKHHAFEAEVRKAWEIPMGGSSFETLYEKLKNIKRALSRWSKLSYRDFLKKITTLEDVVKMKEIQLEPNPTESNRADLRKEVAELRRFQKVEEDYWKQKAGMTQFKEGDKNTKFFHSHDNGRRKRLMIHKIEDA